MRHTALPLEILAVLALGAECRSQQVTTTRPHGGPFELVSILAGNKSVWSSENPLLPRARFRREAVHPDGGVGNQFLLFRFTRPVDAATVFRSESIRVLAYDAATERHHVVRGRWFVGGLTLDSENPDRTLRVVEEKGGGLTVVNPQGDGFPSGFRGDALLGRPDSVVFVADPDGDLRTADTFPSDVLIRVIVSDVRSTDGQRLKTQVAVATTRENG